MAHRLSSEEKLENYIAKCRMGDSFLRNGRAGIPPGKQRPLWVNREVEGRKNLLCDFCN